MNNKNYKTVTVNIINNFSKDYVIIKTVNLFMIPFAIKSNKIDNFKIKLSLIKVVSNNNHDHEDEWELTYYLYPELYGCEVSLNDEFKTELIWNKNLAIQNFGRFEPKLIDEKKLSFWDKPFFMFGKTRLVAVVSFIIALLTSIIFKIIYHVI